MMYGDPAVLQSLTAGTQGLGKVCHGLSIIVLRAYESNLLEKLCKEISLEKLEVCLWYWAAISNRSFRQYLLKNYHL